MTPPDFSDPTKWVTDDDVPILDEHEIVEGGKVVPIDRPFLEKVARRMNRKFARTGDAAAIIVGHTSDHPNAEERPVVGFYTDFRVKYRPEVGKHVLHARQHIRKDKEHVRHDFPRRSVELWVSRHEIDPVALLGGTTPERDLGVIKFGRNPRYGESPVTLLSPEVSPMPAPTKPAPKKYAKSDDLPDDKADDTPEPTDAKTADEDGKLEAKIEAILTKILPSILESWAGGDEGMTDGPNPDGPHGGPDDDFLGDDYHEEPMKKSMDGGYGYSQPSGTNGYTPRQMSRRTADRDETTQERLARLEKENAELAADAALAELEADGVEFDPAEERDLLVKFKRAGHDKAFADYVARIKKNYRRKELDPTQTSGVARYSRQPDAGEDDGADLAEKAVEYARKKNYKVSFDDAYAAVAEKKSGSTRTR